MIPKLQARVAHPVDSKAANQRPTYYDLIKFVVEEKAEINFDEAKKTRDSTSKPKAMMHFHFNSKKSTLPATPAVQMVAPALEEGSGKGEATPVPRKGVTVVSLMKPHKMIQLSLKVMWRLLSEWHKHVKHLQVDVSDATRLGNNSMMRSVKCTTLNF